MKTPIAAFLLVSLSGSVSAAVVSGQTVFDSNPGGVFGDWSHSFSVGPLGVNATQIRILLGSSVFFDTAAGGPGFLLSQDVATNSAGGTGFTGFSATGAGLDGGTQLVLSFSTFSAGKTYTHVGDVDEVVVLQSCGGLAPIPAALCVANNVAITTDGSLVTGAEFAGGTVEVTLGGPALASPVVLTGIFTATGANVATATWTGAVTLVPEPATMLLCGLGLAALGVRRRR